MKQNNNKKLVLDRDIMIDALSKLGFKKFYVDNASTADLITDLIHALNNDLNNLDDDKVLHIQLMKYAI